MRVVDLELLRPSWVPSSFVADENCRQSLKVWLSDGNYYVNYNPPNLSLYAQDSDELKKSFSLDAFRFSAHAAQTVHEMEKTSAYEKLTSWRIIQAYYAAYFSAHAILRFFGKSFSHLETGHVNFLKQRCSEEAGYLPTIASSYYLIELDSDDHTVSFMRYGESHKDLWKCFLMLVSKLEQDALTARASDERRQELSAYFSDLSDALTNRGQYSAGNWLSAVRNEVNYKSLEGVWFPFSRGTPSFGSLLGRVKDWRKGGIKFENLSSERSELERFFVTAFSVVDLGISLSLDYQSLTHQPGRRTGSFSKLLKLTVAA